MPYEPTTNFVDSNNVDLGKKLVTKDYLLSVYETILESSGATGLVVTPELWTWGNGFFNPRLGSNTFTVLTPVTVFTGGTNWKQVACGGSHAAAIKTDGTLWIWGNNGNGQLGNNTNTERYTPLTTFIGGTDWKQVSCGEDHTAAIKTDGSLWTWGAGGDGRLGNFATANRSTPVTTFAGGNNWKQVSCGLNHTAAIKTDGSLWTWGDGGGAQLGNFATADRSTPVTTFAGGNNWKQVSCGNFITSAIKTDGSLWTWGANGRGALGINSNDIFTTRNTPVTTFAGQNTWKQVSMGQEIGMAIKTDGTLWNWGRNIEGQLGINNTTQRDSPVTTFSGGNNWKQVAAGGGNHVGAIKTDGTLWMWGLNNVSGQGGTLGTNDTTQRNTPVTTFAGGNDWKQVAVGREHSQAIQTIDYI
jgi:alpha-tubulin suppressor-like RCC1 family protein